MNGGAYTEPRAALEAAKAPATAIERLRELANSTWNFVRVAVAHNPKATADILTHLAPKTVRNDWEAELAAAVAKHPATPPEVLTDLAKLVGAEIGARGSFYQFDFGVALFINPNTPIEVLRLVLAQAVGKPKLTKANFRKVIARESRRPDVNEMLLSDSNPRVRRAAERTRELLAMAG